MWGKLFERQLGKAIVRGRLPLTLSWYFFSVDPASLTAAQVYSPLSSGEREARMSSVPSSRMDTPGSLPVSSWPLRNQRMTGFGRPEKQKIFTPLPQNFIVIGKFWLSRQKSIFDLRLLTDSLLNNLRPRPKKEKKELLCFTSCRTGECNLLVCNSLLQGTVEGGFRYLNHRGH